MIQRMNEKITRNTIELNEAQMTEICNTGEVDVDPGLVESPYPVIKYGPLGCLATTYDLGNGRIRWKRPCNYRM